jgi:hypothetical protein
MCVATTKTLIFVTLKFTRLTAKVVIFYEQFTLKVLSSEMDLAVYGLI